MKRTARAGRGFTLAETLIAILILALVTAAGTAGVTAVLAVRNRMIEAANAEVLASTASELLADELRFGQNIDLSVSGRVTLDSALYGAGCTLRLSDSTTDQINGEPVPAGRLLAAPPTAALTEPLGEKAYAELQLTDLTFTPDSSGGAAADDLVTVELAVLASGGRELYRTSFTVKPLNGLA